MNEGKQESTPRESDLQGSYNPLDRIGIVKQEFAETLRNQKQDVKDSEKEKEGDKNQKVSPDEKHEKQELKPEDKDVKEEENPPKESKEKNPEVHPEIESLRKRFADSQRLATKVHKVLHEAKKKIADMVDNGDIEEEVSKSLLEGLKLDVSFSETKALEKAEKTPLDAVSEVLTQDVIQQYLDFSEDDHYHKKIFAFQALYDELTGDEQKAIVSEILDEKTPVKILKKILSLGDDNLKSEYGEIIAMGSPKKYAIAQKEKIKKLESDIEKLKRKLSQYEDFDQETSPSQQKESSLSQRETQRRDHNPANIIEAKKRELSKLVANR